MTTPMEHALGAGFHGQVVHNVRISRYAEWLEIAMQRERD